MSTLFPGLRAALGRIRLAVLRHRRLLAALCMLVAVVTGLGALAEPPAPSVEVTVAARDLGAGAVLAAGDLATHHFASGTEPAGRVRDPVGRVLAAPLRRGAAVTDVGLVGPALARGDPGVVAMPVRLPDAATAELLRPGDRVDVLATDPQGGPATSVARRALVLALPPPSEAVSADGLAGRVVVLGVDPEEVVNLASAAASRFLVVVWSG